MKTKHSNPARITFLVVAILSLFVSACGGVRKRIAAPSITLQELQINADRSARVSLRINNFSNINVHFDELELGLSLNSGPPIKLNQSINLDIPGESAEVLKLELADGDLELLNQLSSNQNISFLNYKLDGRINADNPSGRYKIEYAGQLSAVPGVVGAYR